MKVELVYFAWIRERIGQARENVETDSKTAEALIAELAARGEGYAAAFADISAIRVAVDQELKPLTASISGASEVAFFPPMTGG